MAVLIAAATIGWKPLLARRCLSQAQSAMRVRDYGGALERLRKASLLRPAHAPTHLLLARAHRHLGDGEAVHKQLELAQRHGADPQQVERERWLLLAQLGRLREAEPHLAELFDQPSQEQREACEAFVRGYLANLRLSEAEQLLAAWTKDYPEDVQAWRLQGAMHEMTSQFAEAAEAFRRAVELAPDDVETKLRLAEMLVELRRIGESHRLLRECHAARPDDPDVLLAWAKSLQSQGELSEAEASLRRLLQAAPDRVEAQALLGEIALAQHNFDEAIDWLSGVAERRPHDAAARYSLAKALLARGRPSQAQPHLDFVAEAQEPMGRLEAMILKALERPNDAALRFEIGEILWKYGSPDAAAGWMRSVLELDPEHRGAREILSQHHAFRRSDP